MPESAAPEFLQDPYLDWTAKEGIPVTEDFGVDLFDLPMKPWPRFGVPGGIVHLKGRGDFISVFVLDIPAGGKTSPQRHLYEEVVHVLSGHGSTTIELADGAKHAFEWGPNSVFALPLNTAYQHFNGSGSEPARLAATNNLCIMMNVFHKESFIFDNAGDFSERVGEAGLYSGDGQYIPAPRGRQMWESNFIADMGAVELHADPKRGADSSNMIFLLADGIMHCHCSHMPVGTYKKAHRHGPDYHVMIVRGEGFSLLWYDGDEDFVRVDWRDGWMFAPPDQMFHQHFNTGAEPTRYMATAIGNSRYPFTARNRAGKLGVDVSVKEGGLQIELEDQDPRIHRMYLDALARNGVRCEMTEFPDHRPQKNPA
jgi:hypothetical protein